MSGLHAAGIAFEFQKCVQKGVESRFRELVDNNGGLFGLMLQIAQAAKIADEFIDKQTPDEIEDDDDVKWDNLFATVAVWKNVAAAIWNDLGRLPLDRIVTREMESIQVELDEEDL